MHLRKANLELAFGTGVKPLLWMLRLECLDSNPCSGADSGSQVMCILGVRDDGCHQPRDTDLLAPAF